MLKSTLAFTVALVVAPQCTAKQPTLQSPRPALVIDGDSINYNGQDIRLHGIDAPEYTQTCTTGDGVVQAGRMARDYLIRLIDNKPIQCRLKSRDTKYNRPVMTCTNHEGRDLGTEMVKAGWAWAYRNYSLDYLDDERLAAKYRQGVHAMTCEYPWAYRKSHGSGSRPVPSLTPSR